MINQARTGAAVEPEPAVSAIPNPRQRSITPPLFRFAMIGLIVVMLLQLIHALLMATQLPLQSPLLWLPFLLLGAGAALLMIAWRCIHRQLLLPLAELRQWARRLRFGEHRARVTFEPSGDNAEMMALARDINAISSCLRTLSENLDEEVRRQTERIAQKTNSLQVLYDVAASLNASRDLKDLLTRFLYTMRDIVNARAGTVRLLTNDEQMELVASIGLDDEVVELERMVPVQRCLCGSAVTHGEVLFQQDPHPCAHFVGRPLFREDRDLEMIAVPLQYRDRNLGVYNLFVEKSAFENRDEVKALFTSIGRHLGMAIDKAHLDNEAKRLSIMQERNTLAHELHDSLAQTLASLRFQTSMLDESLERQSTDEVRYEVQQIRAGLDDAYTELRELLAHFRAPMNARGLLPALEDLVRTFRKQTGMQLFLQNQWHETRLPANFEMQVLRIIQESLANIRKHSQAHHVRILLRCDQTDYHLLIEDDGIGMSQPAFSGHPGEHIGLSIMEERARFLGGELKIESEPEEGTRVQLTFRHPDSRSADPDPQRFALI